MKMRVRGDGESRRGRQEASIAAACHICGNAVIETTIMFPSGVYFLFGDSSKVCVVGVLPGKNIINKLLEYSRQKAI
jgi:hypothetical protein